MSHNQIAAAITATLALIVTVMTWIALRDPRQPTPCRTTDTPNHSAEQHLPRSYNTIDADPVGGES